jgi:hypothetical protein
LPCAAERRAQSCPGIFLRGAQRGRGIITGLQLSSGSPSIRRLVRRTVTVVAPENPARRAGQIGLAAALQPHVLITSRYSGVSATTDVADIFRMTSPSASIRQPPVKLEWRRRKDRHVAFKRPQGPPGCVHGGAIAAAFDQVFNVANLMSGAAGPPPDQ